MKTGPGTYDALLWSTEVITERAILTVKHAINAGRYSAAQVWPCKPITREQTDKGQQWLLKNRNRKCCKALTSHDMSCLLHLERFTFDGYHIDQRLAGFGRVFVDPIYTVHSEHGWFSYIYTMGELTVLGRG